MLTMQVVVGLLIVGMIAFAVWSATREIRLYKNYLQGNREYLVSKQRRNRRVLIAAVLIFEAALLFAGIFFLNFPTPISALIYWILPLGLIVWLVHLGMRDFRETSKDIDVIVRETCDVILDRKQ